MTLKDGMIKSNHIEVLTNDVPAVAVIRQVWMFTSATKFKLSKDGVSIVKVYGIGTGPVKWVDSNRKIDGEDSKQN